MPVRAAVLVGPRKVLAVIAGEAEVMQCVVSRSIDSIFEGMISDHIRIVNKNGPKVDQDEKDEIEMPLEWEEEHEKMIGN